MAHFLANKKLPQLALFCHVTAPSRFSRDRTSETHRSLVDGAQPDAVSIPRLNDEHLLPLQPSPNMVFAERAIKRMIDHSQSTFAVEDGRSWAKLRASRGRTCS